MADEQFHASEHAFEDALRKLVAEIAVDDYRARIGSPLANNTAYLEAVALLKLSDTVGTARGTRD